VTTNEYPEDARALWIKFKGREWVVMYHNNHFSAITDDNNDVTPKHLDNLFSYLRSEGFINDKGQPPENQQPTNI
jgi:hypothetical protein